MGRFLALALKTGDILAALKALDRDIPAYTSGRRTDSTFAAACFDLDEALRESAVLSLQASAATGSVSAASLLWRMSRDHQVDHQADASPQLFELTPAEAAWIIAGRLKAIGVDTPEDLDREVYSAEQWAKWGR